MERSRANLIARAVREYAEREYASCTVIREGERELDGKGSSPGAVVMIHESSGFDCSRSAPIGFAQAPYRWDEWRYKMILPGDCRVQGKLRFRPCRNARLSEEGDVDTVSGS